jgi:hypothetical protein
VGGYGGYVGCGARTAGLCVEGSGNLLWHEGHHLTDPVICSEYHPALGWMARMVPEPVPGFRWAQPMGGRCGVACGAGEVVGRGALCTDAHGHTVRPACTRRAPCPVPRAPCTTHMAARLHGAELAS